MGSMALRAAIADDWGEIEALLTAASLPLGGLARDYPGGYVIARDDTRIVGCAGIVRYGEAGLLRSVAVSAAVRGQGIGALLIADRSVRRSCGKWPSRSRTTSARAWARPRAIHRRAAWYVEGRRSRARRDHQQ